MINDIIKADLAETVLFVGTEEKLTAMYQALSDWASNNNYKFVFKGNEKNWAGLPTVEILDKATIPTEKQLTRSNS